MNQYVAHDLYNWVSIGLDIVMWSCGYMISHLTIWTQLLDQSGINQEVIVDSTGAEIRQIFCACLKRQILS